MLPVPNELLRHLQYPFREILRLDSYMAMIPDMGISLVVQLISGGRGGLIGIAGYSPIIADLDMALFQAFWWTSG